MADMLSFNTPAQPTNQQQVQQLPAQYQLPLDQIQMKRALAQALLQKGFQQPQGQTIQTGANTPNVYVRPSIIQNVAGLAQEVMGARMLGQSNADMGKVMMDYQQHRQQELSDALAQPTAEAQAAGTPVVSPGDHLMAAGNRLMNSNDAGVRAQGAEYLKVGAELRKNEQDNARARAATAFDAAARASDPGSVLAAAQAPGGMDASQLKLPGTIPAGQPTDPNNPDSPVGTGLPGQTMSPSTGLVSSAAPGNGAIATTEGLPAKIQQKLVEADAQQIIQTKSELGQLWQPTHEAAHNGVVAGAIADILRSKDPITGTFGMDKTKLMGIAKAFGYNPNLALNPTQLLHELSLGFLGAAKTDAGFQGRMTTPEVQMLKTASGSDADLQNPVLLRIAENYKAYSEQQVRNYNARIGDAAKTAVRLGTDPRHFTDKLVTPETIAPVGIEMEPPAPAGAVSAPQNLTPTNRPMRRFNLHAQPIGGRAEISTDGGQTFK